MIKAIRYQSAAELATEHIRDLIHSGVLVPGSKVGIEELAAGLAISSTPVREALKQLQTEGLVQIVPRVGVYVRQIPAQEVREVYAIKESLEFLMVQWATQRGSMAQREAIGSSSEELMSVAELRDVDRYVALVEAHRLRLLEMAQSDVLLEIFRSIDARVRLLRYRNLAQPGRMVESALEHQAIARAVGAGDAARAAALAAAHVQSATRSLARLIDSSDEVLGSNATTATGTPKTPKTPKTERVRTTGWDSETSSAWLSVGARTDVVRSLNSQ